MIYMVYLPTFTIKKQPKVGKSIYIYTIPGFLWVMNSCDILDIFRWAVLILHEQMSNKVELEHQLGGWCRIILLVYDRSIFAQKK